MSEREGSRRRFVIDTNVFVAAIKPFAKPGRKSGEDTATLSLLMRLISDERIELMGNTGLTREYRRLAEELDSPTARVLLRRLAEKTTMARVGEDALNRCKPYLPVTEGADVVHAATALVTGAVLITNDTDFDRIGRARVIKVWSISEAIRRILF